MGKNKLRRFAENATFSNMFQRTFDELQEDGFELRSKWRTEFFKNDNPVVLELACGKGEYTVAMARRYPDKNFIGMDIKGARLWKGCKESNREGLQNVAFIRTKIELIEHFFGPSEVDEIWITFPDPQPRKSKSKKRLTSPEFLQRYQNLITPESLIHLKTDNDMLFHYTLDIIKQHNHSIKQTSGNLYQENLQGFISEIQTHYEQMWLEKGKAIKYICFSLTT
ncbi:MAG: tRNA (guanosine(46)-N7)-methyltransferase TrmB [Bacteroidales bacterium]